MSRDPDSPKRCSYIIRGKYCMEKTNESDHNDESGNPVFEWVECPFENKWIKEEIDEDRVDKK